MKVLEDQMTRNAGRKQSPCMNQNIADGSLRGAAKKRRHTSERRKKVPCHRLSVKCGSGNSEVCWCYRQSHGGVNKNYHRLWVDTVTSSPKRLNRGLNLLVKNGLQMLCKEGKTFSSFVWAQGNTKCIFGRNTRHKQNFCLFTRKLHRKPLRLGNVVGTLK